MDFVVGLLALKKGLSDIFFFPGELSDLPLSIMHAKSPVLSAVNVCDQFCKTTL